MLADPGGVPGAGVGRLRAYSGGTYVEAGRSPSAGVQGAQFVGGKYGGVQVFDLGHGCAP
ncbi:MULTISPECIES: hypothetical protein [Streptomyces]|uniref:hypothetical protein n=1 Tax=Streptomyces TaxID=1883 RepID=UPI0010539B8A|nr:MULTISPECIES: hypothetical protein [Streptomyces]